MMTDVTNNNLMLFSGRGNPELCEEIASHLGIVPGKVDLSTFANGEIYCKYDESVRGANVFILQSHTPPINDRIFEQMIMIDAAKRASASEITAICPFYGYSRQDRKASGREPITARLVADMMEAAGADRVIAIDLHTGQIQGFFNKPVDHLTAVPILAEYLSKKVSGEVTVVSPDAGGGKLARKFAKCFAAYGQASELAFVDKRRPEGKHNAVVAETVVGNIEGRSCILVDDMIDTAGTITAATQLLKDKGAKEVFIAATHGVFSAPAAQRLSDSGAKEVVVTNSLPLPQDGQDFSGVKVVSIGKLFADAVKQVYEKGSVSELFTVSNFG
jgi:ribose-phosphate pyrophosphokinase